MLEIAFTTCAKSLPLGAVPLVFRQQCRKEAPPLGHVGNNRIARPGVWDIALDQTGQIPWPASPRDQNPLVAEPLNGTSDGQTRRSTSSPSRPI